MVGVMRWLPAKRAWLIRSFCKLCTKHSQRSSFGPWISIELGEFPKPSSKVKDYEKTYILFQVELQQRGSNISCQRDLIIHTTL